MNISIIRISILWSIVSCAAVVITVSLIGKQGRTPPSEENIPSGVSHAVIVNKTSDLYYLWKKQGYSGNVLIHVGNYLHFIPQNSPLVSTRRLPSREEIVRQILAYESALTHRNVLWVAMQENMLRYIHVVLPHVTYEKKRQEISRGMKHAPSYERAILRSSEIDDAEMGLLRTLSDTMPKVNEPVLVNIDASYLATSDIQSFAMALKQSGLRIRLLTFCLSEDSPDVNDQDRERLRQLAQILTADHFIPGSGGMH